MKYFIRIIIVLYLIFCFWYACYAEQINENCYRFNGVLVCGATKQKANIPKKEEKEQDVIVKTYWEKVYTNEQICDAIYIIEGKEKARQPFGIETIECKTYEKCEKICLNTIENNRKRFKNYGWKQFDTYLEFLANRYCPPNSEIWLKNLKYYLNKS